MPADIASLIQECTRFLPGHYPRSVRELMQSVVDSPLSEKRRDIYGSGGVVADLEVELAELLGKEAAVFMPSGTMAQQIALRIWADEADNPTIAFHPTCHLEIHEQMAYRELHHLQAILLGEAGRLFTLDDLKAVDTKISSLLIELPQREIGGQLPTWDDLSAICAYAKSAGVRLHMDGARLWECAPFYGRSYVEIAKPFDSVYVSFYKILGGLPGAILAGPKELIDKARIWQRRHGGNLHQLSPNAITAKLGMERHLPRIPEYVAKAREVTSILRSFDQIKVVPSNPPTNMMHLYFSGDPSRLLDASWQIGKDDKVLLIPSLSPQGKMELTIGEAALDIEAEEIRRLFDRLFQLAE